MNEQQLRAAVAEYDAEMARFGDWEFGLEPKLHCDAMLKVRESGNG